MDTRLTLGFGRWVEAASHQVAVPTTVTVSTSNCRLQRRAERRLVGSLQAKPLPLKREKNKTKQKLVSASK